MVFQPGGRVGAQKMEIPGLHPYKTGEEAVLFLEKSGARLIALGIGIATYEVRREGDTATVYFEPKVMGASKTASGKMRIEPMTADAPISLKDFRAKINAALKD